MVDMPLKPNQTLISYNCRWSVLIIVTWSSNCLLKIIITYLKPYVYKQNDSNQIEWITQNHIIIKGMLDTIKLWANYLYYIGILDIIICVCKNISETTNNYFWS